MKTLLSVLFYLIYMMCHANFIMPKGGGKGKGDSSNVRKSVFKFKREISISSPVIEKMSDKQLMLLIDHMVEAVYIPHDLWSQVMMETAKRNLSKINRREFNIEASRSQSTVLYIEKLLPDPVDPAADPNLFLYPAHQYYHGWNQDIPFLFKDRFTADTTYMLELENTEFGYFNMPSWGPMSSPFGWRNKRYHKGIDIQLKRGDTVSCAFDGMVRFAQKKGGYGNIVIVRHYNGLETVYAHLWKINVKEGDVIGAGELIGLAGSTGHSTGPHLHFEVRFMGVPVNPQYFISFDYGNLLFNTVVLKKNKTGLLSAFHPNTEFHTVENGETFAEIANHYCTTTTKLRTLNDMTPRQYIRLKQGQTLRVRIIDLPESASGY